MVVLYHCFCPWMYSWNWYETSIRPYYSFIFESLLVGRMALFVFVSGYLFSYLKLVRGKYATFTGFLWNKTKRLMIPCLIFTIVISLSLQGNPVKDFFGYGYHMWFLKMLFFSFITCWLMSEFVKSKFGELLCFAISICMMFLPYVEFMSIGQYFKYYFFFYFGYLSCKYRAQLTVLNSKKGLSILLAIAVIVIAVLLYQYITSPKDILLGDIIHKNRVVALCREFLRPLTILLVFSVVNHYLENHPDSTFPFFNWLNGYSYGIYIIHDFLLQLLAKYTNFRNAQLSLSFPLLTPVILFIFVFGLSILITFLMKKTKTGRFLIG